ncbi:MAG: RluA family pseudouridine synthase [Ruminiclostridium sp.]|jgi:23S rRNA pseudouridine1911/1915/1917 synthase|nr:RluA family pseudouridine synthase [Ruminiclostridium sp.]
MLDILYQDDALVVCVKPFRVLSTDEPGGMPDLIREALGQPHAKVRAVHRLDQVVGGLMVYGLSAHAASELSRQIRENRFVKEYQAVIHWRPREDQGTFRDLLGRNEKTRKTYVTQTPAKGVQEAVLHYQLLDNRQGFSLVQIQLETGRTHQIRAQFSARGLPLAGDRKYSRYPDPKDWQIALWSNHLSFTHPETGEAMDFRLPPPETEPWTLFQATGRN